MNIRKTPASSMQKTYDECYLTCSTAIYFEGQNNEAEALRAWRNALDQIYYHNAYKMPSSYTPRTETEKALQHSLRTMEMQCKERVDLLEALKKSREEAADPTKQADLVGNSQPAVADQASINKALGSDGSKQWLGNDTVPQTAYEDLPKATPPKQNVPVRSANPLRPFFATRKSSDQDTSRTRSLPHATSATSLTGAALAPPPSKERRSSRTPSPEKRGGMLRTLRNNGARDTRDRSSSGKMPSSMRTKPQPAAAKAASQVWIGSPRASLGSAEQVSSTVASPPANTWDPYRRSLVNNSPTSERHDVTQTFIRPPSPRDYIVARPHHSASESSEGERTKPSRTSQQASYLNAYRPNQTSTSSTRNDNGASKGPAVPPHTSSGWFSAPKAPRQSPGNKPVATTSERATKQTPAQSASSLAEAGQAQPMTYLKEFPNHPPAKPRKPPEIAMREAANLAVGSRKAQPSTAPPIPRKAIGGHRAAGVVNAVAQRQKLDAEQSHASPRVTDPPIAATMPPVPASDDLAKPTPGNSTEDESQQNAAHKQAWDSKVAAILKDLPKGVDEAAAKQILNEIVIQGDEVHWSDVAGLEAAKSALKETVVYPFLRPDLFMGLREPARGMLLFGPPGTGKTMLARAVATESRSIFFAISASSLTSKYLGDSEKLVRALFQLAKAMAPAIIFVDEIDSLLGSRGGSSEHEATRRIKTEFLIQWSDLQKAAAGRVDEKHKEKGDPTRVLVLAATNLPWAIDEAARRRFVRRQYIPLPEEWVRKAQLQTLLAAQKHSLAERELAELVRLTDGYSGSDITALAKDAAMGPLRSLGEKLLHMTPEDIRPIGMEDFQASLNNIRPSVSRQGLKEFEDWAREFGERGG